MIFTETYWLQFQFLQSDNCNPITWNPLVLNPEHLSNKAKRPLLLLLTTWLHWVNVPPKANKKCKCARCTQISLQHSCFQQFIHVSEMIALLFQCSRSISMGSPGCEQVGSTTHLPLYTHTDTMRSWQDEEEDIKPPRNLLGLPELSWPGVYIPYCDRLVPEDTSWLLKMAEVVSPPLPPSKATEQCPAINSQGLCPPSELESQVEERCLEQVQTMVVGEVLKDIDTACKLLNITPGRTTRLYWTLLG